MPDDHGNHNKKHPTHFVLLKSATDDSLTSFLRDLKMDPGRRQISARSGVETFSRADRAGARLVPEVRVFRQFRIAALSPSDDVLDRLRRDGRVDRVFPNREIGIPDVARPDSAPTEMPPTGPESGPPAPPKPLSKALVQVGLTTGNSEYTGSRIKVGVLDTGIDLDHPDFKNRLKPGNAESFVYGESVDDGNGHGTHCAGLIAGPIDTAGAWRYGTAPDAELLVAKIVSNAGSGWEDNILEGLLWAALKGANIVSMSVGGEREPNEPPSILYEIVGYALRFFWGILPVAAAGNYSDRSQGKIAPIIDPAVANSVMAVAAVDHANAILRDCCGQADAYGTLSVSAPGAQVYSSWPEPTNFFGGISGTSAATPHVAGIAALHAEALEALNGIPPTPGELQAAIENSALALGNAADFGHGLIQAP